jgi:hypothetical protein
MSGFIFLFQDFFGPALVSRKLFFLPLPRGRENRVNDPALLSLGGSQVLLFSLLITVPKG